MNETKAIKLWVLRVNGKFGIIKNSSQNTQSNCEKIQQKFQVKNLQNLFWVRNPRNCVRSVDQQEA